MASGSISYSYEACFAYLQNTPDPFAESFHTHITAFLHEGFHGSLEDLILDFQRMLSKLQR